MASGKAKSRLTRRKPPSREVYEYNNPIVSCRLKREHYEQLKGQAEKSRRSLGDLIRESLAVQEANTYAVYLWATGMGTTKDLDGHSIMRCTCSL